MIGDELRKARQLAGMSQEALAEKAGVHRTYVSILERNKKSPTLHMLFRLCAALHVRASDIVRNIEEREDTP